MSERIDQLLVKAGAYFGAEGVLYDQFDPKKFAELIVRECAHVGFNAAYPGKAVDVKIAIKEHFGVES